MTHYILDGYNVIQSGPDRLMAAGSLENKREFLLELVRESKGRGGFAGKVTVVFDGPESSPFMSSSPAASVKNGIKVVFSEGKTADERIVDMVNGSPGAGDITVVTNDKGIRRLLGGTGAKFMEVREFAEKIFPGRGNKNTMSVNSMDPETANEINNEFKGLWLKRK